MNAPDMSFVTYSEGVDCPGPGFGKRNPTNAHIDRLGVVLAEALPSERAAHEWAYMVLYTLENFQALIPDMAQYAAGIADSLRKHSCDEVRLLWLTGPKPGFSELWLAGRPVDGYNAWWSEVGLAEVMEKMEKRKAGA